MTRRGHSAPVFILGLFHYTALYIDIMENTMQNDNLGKLLGQHKSQGAISNIVTAVVLILILIGVTLAINSPICFGLALLGLLFLGYMIWGAVHQLNAQISVYEGGVTHSNLFQNESWRWDELDGMTTKVTTTTQSSGSNQLIGFLLFGLLGALIAKNATSTKTNITSIYFLYAHKKLALKVDNSYKDVQDLGHLLRETLGGKLLPGYLETLNQGQTVEFSTLQPSKKIFPILVSPQGIQQGSGYPIPWQEIRSVVGTQTGNLIIELNNRQKVTILMTGILNDHVISPLIQAVMKSKGLRLAGGDFKPI
jgi:hypothetical protein